MPWSSLPDNQTISRANLQDAINNGLFTLKSAFTSDNKQITKANANTYINIPSNVWPGFVKKDDTQLLTKYDLPTASNNYGQFILDAQYGLYFTSMSGSVGGLPTFSFPVTGGNTTVNFSYNISVQSVSLGIDGIPTYTPINVAMYLNSALISSQQINSWPNTYTFSMPAVFPGDTVRFAINTGSVPPPTSYTFQNQSISNVFVSKTNGSIQLATTGKRVFGPASRDAVVQGGYLWRSGNYGSSFTNTGIFGFWTSLSGSDDGVYLVATSAGDASNNAAGGYVYYSTNSGASWTAASTPGRSAWSGSCVFNNANMVVCSSNGQMYRSGTAGASWTAITTKQQYASLACGSSNGNAVLSDIFGQMYLSSDFGNNFTASGYNSIGKIGMYNYGIKMSSNGTNAILMRYSYYADNYSTSIMYSTDSGLNWSTLSGSALTVGSSGYWIGLALSNSSYSYGVTTNIAYTKKITNFSGFTDLSNAGTAGWQSIDVNNGGNYILIGGSGGTSGLFRSSNSGTSFIPV